MSCEVVMTIDRNHLLHGQAALVTGASSGIGESIARCFAAAGAAVGVHYHSGSEAADAVVSRISESGGKAVALRADVSSEDQVQSLFAEFEAEFGRIDILVANAGIQEDASTVEMTAEQWRRVLDVNLTGQFLCAREAIRRFWRQESSPHSRAAGKIVCMSSVHELIPWAGHVNYAASKGGVMLMMKTLAQETAGKRIRVNGIAPGAIKTPINRESWETPDAERELLKLIPYGRIGETEDVAEAALWLASDLSDYVTGATIFVDGGMALYPGFEDAG
jgi:glucose 1-dehydrogenase